MNFVFVFSGLFHCYSHVINIYTFDSPSNNVRAINIINELNSKYSSNVSVYYWVTFNKICCTITVSQGSI